jgi:hypothetical protein
MKERLAVLMIVALAVGILVPTAHAGFVMKLTDGTTTVTIADNGAGDDKPLVTGQILWTGTIGVWDINVDTGLSKPNLGGPTVASMDLSAANHSTRAGTLTISLTDTGFTLPTTGSLLSEIGGTTPGSVTLTQIFDPDNSEFAALDSTNDTVVASPSLGSGAFSWTGTKGIEVFASPFSITEVAVINHSGAGYTTFDASSVVPVPGAILLGFLGLSAAGLRLRRFA